jgi:hypothetical protein
MGRTGPENGKIKREEMRIIKVTEREIIIIWISIMSVILLDLGHT